MAVTENEECHIIDEAGNIIFSRKRNYAMTPGPFSEGMAQTGREIDNDSIETIKFILSKGADPNLPDNKGMTPIGIAEEYCYEHMIILLKKWKNMQNSK